MRRQGGGGDDDSGGSNSGGGNGGGGSTTTPAKPHRHIEVPRDEKPRTRPVHRDLPVHVVTPPVLNNGGIVEHRDHWKPPRNFSLAQRRSMTLNAAIGLTLPVIYGNAPKCGGLVAYRKITTGGRLVVQYLIGHGPVNSITNIKIGGKTLTELALTVSGTDYEVFTGTAAQAASTILAAADTAQLSKYPGIAYVVVSFNRPTKTIPYVDPLSFVCDVQGLLVRDPRTDATLVNRYYRENPALIVADLKTSKRYGQGRADSTVDFAGTVTTTANGCDFNIGGGVPRYKVGFRFADDRTPEQWIEEIRPHAALYFTENDGLFQILQDVAQTASGFILTDAGSTANILDAKLAVHGSQQVPSHVVVHYIDVSTGKDGSAEYEDPAVVAGTRERVIATYELHGCPTYDQAKRTVIYLYNRAQQDKTAAILVNAEGVQPLAGTRITVTSAQLNVANQDMIVTDLHHNDDGTWRMTCEWYSSTVYSDTPQSRTDPTTPTIQSPYDVPPEVRAFKFTTTGTFGENDWRQYVTWSAPHYSDLSLWGTSYWVSPTGFLTFDGTKINDGNTATVAATWTGGTSPTVVYDAGVGITKTLLEVRIDGAVAATTTSYSDDNVTYTPVSFAGGINDPYITVGAHRYWKFTLSTSGTINELAPIFSAGQYPHVKGYNVYDLNPSPKALIATVHLGSDATIQPVEITRCTIINRATPNSAILGAGTQFSVTVVSTKNVESPGATSIKFSAGAAATTGITAVNGLNSNLSIGSKQIRLALTGPTLAYSIGGFTATATTDEQRFLTVENNTAQVCTLVHEDVSSTATNRIDTGKVSAGNYDLQPNGSALLIYNGTRWRLIAVKDNTTGGGGGGTVTSVGLSLPASTFSITGSPVTAAGTLTGSFATQPANTFLAGPSSGGAATPSWRGLVAADQVQMVGDSGAGGTKGVVPAPASGDAAANKYLKANGAWQLPLYSELGTVPILNGGTGQTTALAAYDALAPTTTQGDITLRGLTTSARLPLGTKTFALRSNGTTAAWLADATVLAADKAPSSTTYVATGMTVSFANLEEWVAEFVCFVNLGTVSTQFLTFKLVLTGTVSISQTNWQTGTYNGALNCGGADAFNTVFGSSTLGPKGTTATTGQYVPLLLQVHLKGSATGSIELQVASGGAYTTTLKAGSYFYAYRIA